MPWNLRWILTLYFRSHWWTLYFLTTCLSSLPKNPERNKQTPDWYLRYMTVFSSAGELSAVTLGLTGILLICSSSVFLLGVVQSSHCYAEVCLWLCEQAQISWLSNNSLHSSLAILWIYSWNKDYYQHVNATRFLVPFLNLRPVLKGWLCSSRVLWSS